MEASPEVAAPLELPSSVEPASFTALAPSVSFARLPESPPPVEFASELPHAEPIVTSRKAELACNALYLIIILAVGFFTKDRLSLATAHGSLSWIARGSLRGQGPRD
jgi:hypothetical protein